MARGERPPAVIRYNGLVLDPKKQQVTVHGEKHHLTPKECKLLATLIEHSGKMLTREFLMREVWQTSYVEDTRTLEVHVSWLRRKIEEDVNGPRLILTIRGIGYMFAPMDTTQQMVA